MTARASLPPGDSAEPQTLRSDALINRNRILEVARETFAARGIDVTMREIARRAGVGVATLYRRFPTKESLVAATFTDQMAACASVVDDALADPDPWRGFCTVVERICAMQAVDKGFTAAFVSAFPDSVDFEGVRVRAEEGFAELTGRAKACGQLRADFAQADLTLLIMANGGIVANTAEVAPAASRRLAALLLQSFRAHPADPPAPLPPPAPLGLHHVVGAPKGRHTP